ncbi:TPA: fimbria/pilus periplasmic chaperone, partial [Serratia odorifera]
MLIGFFLPAVLFADGMRPDTTVIVLHEAEGEVSINVTNTDSSPALLHSVIEDVPEDTEQLIVV